MLKEKIKKIWNFFWKEDSALSWIVNIIVAFLLIKFFVYPMLGLMLGTGYPIVAVVSESMEHGLHDGIICGQRYNEFPESLENYWQICGPWYEQKGINLEQFRQFPFQNGFDKGDVIVLWRANQDNLKIGDVLVFQGNKPQPIIHRVVNIFEDDEGLVYYHTKGDHNSDSITKSMDETKISTDKVYGKGLLRIPYLGWIKILFVDLMNVFGIVIEK